MASKTYTAKGIVLRKTLLGETDLIITFLDESGAQLRCVAKGARKPSSSFSSRLELYSLADVLCVEGKKLDIVKEARLISPHSGLRSDIEHASCAAPIAELLDYVSQEGLQFPRLFDMTQAAFSRMDTLDAQEALSICAAHLLKTLCIAGFTPSLTRCVSCGREINLTSMGDLVRISEIDGGIVCDACASFSETKTMPTALAQWCQTIITSTFDEIIEARIDAGTSFAVLEFAHQWCRVHVGKSLKSLNFLFTCGLF